VLFRISPILGVPPSELLAGLMRHARTKPMLLGKMIPSRDSSARSPAALLALLLNWKKNYAWPCPVAQKCQETSGRTRHSSPTSKHCGKSIAFAR
jgi:hypothetical protein